MNLNQEIVELLKQEGCDIVGFADLRTLPEEPRKGFDFGIVMGASYTAEGMREHLDGKPGRFADDSGVTGEYLDRYTQTVLAFLKKKGYKASDKYSTMQITYKMLGTISGLGWIGRCAILTTKETGPALRLSAVLTDAPVECGTPVAKSKCPPDCSACADICPADAIKGGLWELGVHRDEFFDVKACREMRNNLNGFCGLCISACPYTQKGLGYEGGGFDVKRHVKERIRIEKARKRATKLSPLGPFDIVDLPDENRTKVVEINRPDGWAVVTYTLKKYKNQTVTIRFSADVKRIGAAGDLHWQINNTGHPIISSVFNADTDMWHTMSGEWTGTLTDPSPLLLLSTWENNSDSTTYYIDRFSIDVSI